MKRFYLFFLLLIPYFIGLKAAALVALPIPSTNPNSVISFYGYYNDTYGLGQGMEIGNWDNFSETTTGVRCLYKEASGNGIIDLKRSVDISEMTHLHVDLWATAVSQSLGLQFRLWDNGDQRSGTVTKSNGAVTNSWVSFDIPLSDFSTLSTTLNNKVQAIYVDGTGAVYMTNAYLYNNNYSASDAPQVPAPTPTLPIDGVFSFYNDNPYGVSNGAEGSFSQYPWNCTYSTHILGMGESALKTVFNGQGALPYEFSTPSDLSSYTHVHFDIWAKETMNTQELIFALYKDGGTDDGRSQMSVGNVSAKTWTGFDLKLSEFSRNDVAENLPTLKTIRFETSTDVIGSTKTYYIDNVYFYTQVIDENVPQVPAYLPPAMRDASNVISIFSDSYTNISEVPAFSPAPIDTVLSNNNIRRFENTGSFSLGFEGTPLDISGMTHVHMDIWTKAEANINIGLNGFTQPDEIKTVAGEWLRLDIPISEFQEGLAAVNSLNVTGDMANYYVDNVYFYKDQPQFTVDISEYNASMKKGINLGDIFDFNETGRWNPEYIDMIADLGFSHVRLPVRWEDYGRSMSEAPYNINPVFMNTIREIVDRATARDLKIIVNMHHHDKFTKDPVGQRPNFKAQWTQIADYFRYYPDNLIFEVFNEPYADASGKANITPDVWNEVLLDGLEVIRPTNPNRPVLIGLSQGGGIDGLKYLQLPVEDQNLIVTIHYYNPSDFTHQGAEWANPIPPVGTEWLDTEVDRENVEKDLKMVTDFLNRDNRPVHFGEFGAIDKADMDSRVRWTTYIARSLEARGYSWAYWDFDAKFGIYDPVNEIFRQPLIDALISNPMPADPSQIGITLVETLYDSNVDGIDKFSCRGANQVSIENEELTIRVTSGGSEVYDVQAGVKVPLVKGKSYRVSFMVSVETGYDHYYQNYLFRNVNEDYTKYSQIKVFKPSVSPTLYSYIFTMEHDDHADATMMFDLGGTGDTPVSIKLRDIKIENVEIRFEAAPIPTLDENKVYNIYSSVYSGNKNITYSNEGDVSNVDDSNDGEIILFSDFEEQIISLPANLNSVNARSLHLDVYAGSPMDLKINLLGNVDVIRDFSIPAHKWTPLDIDLSSVLFTGGEYINTIKLSGGTGAGRKLYFDHLYSYDDLITGLDPANESEDGVRIFNTENEIRFITDSDNPIQQLFVYEIQGRLLFADRSVNSSSYIVKKEGSMPAIYVMKLICEKNTKSVKFTTIK